MSPKQVYSLYLRFETEASKIVVERSEPLKFTQFEQRWTAMGKAEQEKLLTLYQTGLAGPTDDELAAMCEGMPQARQAKKREPAIMKGS